MILPEGYVAGFVCTLATCDVKLWGFIHYQPSLVGNILFLVLLDLLALAQLVLGIKYKTGLVCVSMLLGLACESLGYVARILLHYDPFNRAYFLWYLITLTLGPVFIAAAIYLCLGRIVMVYGEGMSRIRARSYTVIFMACDLISLVVQAGGGGLAASVPLWNQNLIDIGTNILVAGLSFQVASLFAFLVCSADFLLRVRKRKDERKVENADLYNDRKFKLFLVSLAFATLCLFVRTVFRSVELSEGFSGRLANSEVQFMVLDGVMVILASTALTVMHPGFAFGNKWAVGKFKFRKEKTVEEDGPTETGEKTGPSVIESPVTELR
ncbi:hypothetical protein ONS95_012803 [Cadophora gregata]|uniref:uncharacterized protein n=1 Tax=Cadophora gregata TaxID=51156 RepID=UPI0026DD5FE7|nr:uncharacterized protein ONS95_012803 [Cadophora gregata]KAK0101215.1 hypothetical protein ONS96_006437 [Cadophora gregata f. sp. sojae]KAK0115750.1 hypothetical protein ONS95_012803 [Cadophora gregata]